MTMLFFMTDKNGKKHTYAIISFSIQLVSSTTYQCSIYSTKCFKTHVLFGKNHVSKAVLKTESSTYLLQTCRDTGTASRNSKNNSVQNFTAFSIVLLLLQDLFDKYAEKIYQHNLKTIIWIIAVSFERSVSLFPVIDLFDTKIRKYILDDA